MWWRMKRGHARRVGLCSILSTARLVLSCRLLPHHPAATNHHHKQSHCVFDIIKSQQQLVASSHHIHAAHTSSE